MKIIYKIVMSSIILLIMLVIGGLAYIIYNNLMNNQINSNVVAEEEFRTEIDNSKEAEEENSQKETIPSNSDSIIAELENQVNNQTVDEPEPEVIVEIDKYFYNQLNEYSKRIYEEFYENEVEMRTGTYKVQFGGFFTSTLQKQNGSELLGDYYQSAIEAYLYDNPNVFYLNVKNMYLNIETITKGGKKTYNVYIDNGEAVNYLADGFNSKTDVDNALAKIESEANYILSKKTNNTYENIKMVHDYLIDNIEYDRTISNLYIYDIYGALVNKDAVCEGYAKSFKYLMDKLGIPCVMVIGEATNSTGNTENHAWNYVEINNNWYAIDTTWDDPISETGYVGYEARYRYFLVGENEIRKDHVENNQFTVGGKIFNYPNLSKENYVK